MKESAIAERRQRIEAELSRNPGKMTLQIARDLNVPEAEVIRAFPPQRVQEMEAAQWEEILRALAGFGKVHVIVSNAGATVEVNGEFGNFSTWGEFFNVQSKTLDMHIRFKEIASIFAVEKPSHMDGVNTLSVQFFDQVGAAMFKVFLSFGASSPKPETAARFTELRGQFCRDGATA